ncbi:MAG TPA: TIGR03545 family protein [Planctomycetaceae bacterium]|jgi:uncharacterized protein (TIGR03545 family)
MRWGYIIPRVLVLAGIWAFFAFGFDPSLRLGAISAAQKAVGAKVEIGAIKTGSLPLGLWVSNVQVANRNAPGTNLIEFESLVLEVSGEGLARKSLIVDEGELTGLRWGTPRQDSGLLPAAPAQKDQQVKDEPPTVESDSATAKFETDMQARGKNLFGGLAGKAKLAIDPNRFESVRMGTELEKKWDANFSQLEAQANDLKKEIDDIKQLAQSKNGNNLDRLEGFRKALTESKDALQRIKQLKTEVDAEKQQSRTDFAAFNQARDRDLTRIREQVDLFQADPQQIAEYLLGPELHRRISEIIDWTKWARTNYSRAAHDPAPARMRGEVIEFTHETALPRVLIKLLKISGQGEVHDQPLEFTGTLTGLTSNPVLYGQPAVLQMNAEGPADVDLKVVFDYTNPDVEPSHEVFLTYTAGHAPPLHLGDDGSLAVTVTGEKLTCRAQLKLVGESLTGTLQFQQQPATLTAKLGGDRSQVDSHVIEGINDIFAGIKNLQGTLQIRGTLESPQLAIQSNIGQQIATGMNTALAHQLDQGREALAAKLNDQVAQQTDKLKGLFKQKSQGLAAQLNLNEQQVTQLMQQVTGGPLAGLDKGAGNPLDILKKSADPSKPINAKKATDEIQGGLKKLFR